MEYCVSAIIPVDRQAEGLEKTLDSLFRQSLAETEILAVDCGMSDLNREMVETYQPGHGNLVLLPSKNHFVGTAKNLGLRHASGEYVTFLNPGEWVPEPAYASAYDEAKKQDAEVIIGHCLERDCGGEWVPKNYGSELAYGRNYAGEYRVPIKNPSCGNKLIQRGFLFAQGLLFSDLRVTDDLFFAISLFGLAHRIFAAADVICMKEFGNSGYSRRQGQMESLMDEITLLKKIGLRFHENQMVIEQALCLEKAMKHLLPCIRQLPDGSGKDGLLEELKGYFQIYRGMAEYQMLMEYCFGIDSNTFMSFSSDTRNNAFR